jgi:hypothetical protein
MEIFSPLSMLKKKDLMTMTQKKEDSSLTGSQSQKLFSQEPLHPKNFLLSMDAKEPGMLLPSLVMV